MLFGDDFTVEEWAHLLYDAYIVAKESPDPSTQNGALIWTTEGRLIGFDCNRFPTGVEYRPERWERPLKYEAIEHAERNSIFHAAGLGQATEQTTMVAPWAACSDCARAIIQAGVRRLVRHQQATDHFNSVSAPGRDWTDTISFADQMLKEAGVEVVDIDWNFHDHNQPTNVLEIRHCGEIWRP